ncbi:DUF1549 and DUF1553 domain-containing protein [Zavarzinella formosa]|uniref:DUF1549 and DUF1553 domain-containing protein n=1 Tax=Zavarzinella formosa TaxID=360055 RepID=UPI0012F8E37C|nr:DUF1549 and DUF1553 domain-containing protein [Zavarzinella formosa]
MMARFFTPAVLLIAWGFASPAAFGAVTLPTGGKIQQVDFERHLMGLFSKAGCNNGSCHGSFQGKNGFRLSLFGLDPDKDFAALTRDIQGRRADPIDPDNSLLLLKATGAMKHDGGIKFSRDSWQYAVMREWIKDGMPRRKGAGEIKGIEVSPKDMLSLKAGQKAQIKVTATFTDESKEDITPFCDFRMQDDAVARVTPFGEISGIRPGDSGFVVLYRGQVASLRILVPTPMKPGFKYPKIEAVNYVDKEVFAKLKMLNVVPSDLAGDTEFLRRVTIDTTGSLPTPDEIRQFLADQSPDKRTRKIDDLLKTSRHAALWATKFSDITGNNTLALEQPQGAAQNLKSQMWHDWFRSRVEQNMPYDEIVRGVMTATSRDGKTPEEWLAHVKKIEEEGKKFDTSEYAGRKTLDMFWRRQAQVPSIEWSEKTAAAFLGVRLECAQCHKHPTDRWTQADYRAFANLFTNINFAANQFSSPDVKKVIDAENAERTSKVDAKNKNQVMVIREMFIAPEPRGKNVLLTHPETNAPLKPKAIAGPEFTPAKGKDLRGELFEWMRSPENPFFARSFVNRVWGHYFGAGIVDPVDDFSQANPPTNTRLLDALAKDFIESKYDIRRLERTILMSRTYQNSSTPNDTNRLDKNNYARSYVRPMLAEVVVDVVNDAIGTTETFGNDAPAGKRMIEIGASRINNANVAYALRIFGRPPRTTACDCERAMEPALPQTLFRMTDPALLQKMKSPANRFNLLLKDRKRSDEAIFEEVFLAAMSRFPTPRELDTFYQHRLTNTDRAEAFADVVWALINTREFILNH